MSDSLVHSLPQYPSAHAQKSLSPFQLSQFTQTISSALLHTLALPPTKRDTPASRAFVSSYARDTALQLLQALIWKPQTSPSNVEKGIKKRVLLLATKLALSPPGLDLRTLLDLAIIYAPMHPSRTRDIFVSSLESAPSLLSTFQSQVVSPFTTLLSPAHSSGLYGLRKTARCLRCLLHVSPPELIRLVSHDKPFVLTLARAYGEGLAAIARSYGGIHAMTGDREADDWETIWMETKVDLIDTFHIILTTTLKDISSSSGPTLAREAECAFDIIFSLLDLSSSSIPFSHSAPSGTLPPITPFLNRSLLADYQQAYSLSQTLTSVLHHAAEKDARIDLLESSLRSLESNLSESGADSGKGHKDAGGLKLLLRSSGVPPGVDHRGHRKGKGKAHPAIPPVPATVVPSSDLDPDLEDKVNQVLDIFPDHSRAYIRALLVHPVYPFRGSAEGVVGALLEGTAPGYDVMGAVEEVSGMQGSIAEEKEEDAYTMERKNVWDEDVMNLNNVHVGKKIQDEATILKDRTFIEQMKADILRRAEEISSEEDEERHGDTADSGPGKGKEKFVFEDEQDDALGLVKVVGDGEDSSEAEESDEDEGPVRQAPETILELAYIRDSKVFERDGATRRGKARAELRGLTGWADEQIEGWRIMLERNPKKDSILQKHEFAGNRASHDQVVTGVASDHQGHPRGRGRGRGGSGGRGAGRGGGDGGNTRERAWKDKNKASRGNHNRKRGHDKKMAKAGGPS